ncbi:MAG: glycoside hydrolase [Gloeocapsa sp. DLM2.Bin57]|nr:MAG: glycoside hydrolase [Gloeocapsa sp. DLM2.Bin57]
MSHPLYIAFIWHQHQPLYKNSQGKYLLPWVRLHGTKDYLDLALLLSRYPKLHQTINLVPSLILQLEDYIKGTAFDPYLELTLTPEENLNLKQKEYIIEHFFDANHHTLIDPHPRYSELYYQKQNHGEQWCQENWTKQEYADLLAWHNLAWIDPLFWDDPEIEQWLKQGRNFSLSDRQRIISKQRQILSRIIPQHKQMQERGQLEVTTTPYTHPILPLLADTNSGRVAVMDMTLPENRFQWAEDIPRHLRKAKAMYVDRFGQTPRGLWPSEQSVSPEILPYIAKEGFNWICSDEAVLGWSLKHFFHRDETGNVYEPELLYQPYRLVTPYGDLSIVFRDHRLSDLIGFSYGGMDANHAVGDLIGHLEAIARRIQQRGLQDEPWLVTIALDGENCWEFYQQDGLPFLSTLYERLSQQDNLQLVTVSEFLTKFPPKTIIPSQQLHSGSWVDGSFTTWIGDPVKNKAWDLLTQARQVLAKHPEATEENNPEVWEALYAAEGSDWFWWFGEGHSSNQDAIFDQLFREHLKGIYRSLNEKIPPNLSQPVDTHHQKRDHLPQSFIHPVINGSGDEQDWDKAGRLEVGGARGTMHRSSVIQQLYYGWDHLHFYVRLDFQRGSDLNRDLARELHLLWYYPGIPKQSSPIPLAGVPNQSPLNYLYHHHLGIDLQSQSLWLEEAGNSFSWNPRFTRSYLVVDHCLELAVPWSDIHVQPDYNLELVMILANQGHFQGYLPENQLVKLVVP